MIKILEKYPILTIITFTGVMLLPFLNAMEVTIMEARNFVTAREMLTDGNWILTTMNGVARYEKPPLPTWLSAISAAIFGAKSVWAMRFPAILMVMLLGVIIFTLSRKLKLSTQHSLINSLISITSLYVVLIIFEAPWDIYTHAFMFAGIYFLFKRLQDNKSRFVITDWLLASICIAASVLSKGPVSLYVLFLPFLISYIIIFRKETNSKKWIAFVISLIIGMAIGFSWYAYVRYADSETFTTIVQTETGNWTSFNVRPFYYYWSFFIQSGVWAIPALISLLYPYMKSRVSDLKIYRFTLFWTFIAVLLLSVIPEKKSRHLMPVLIPLAINIGFYIEYIIRKGKRFTDKRELLPMYFNFGLLSFILTLIPFSIIYFVINQDIKVTTFSVIFFALSLIPTFIFTRSLLRKDFISVFYNFIISITLIILGASSLMSINKFNIQYQRTLSSAHNDDIPYYSLCMDAPEFFWDLGHKTTPISQLSDIVLDEQFYIVICANYDNTLIDNFKGYTKELVRSFDINYSDPNSSSYKKRKMGNIFLFKKQ